MSEPVVTQPNTSQPPTQQPATGQPPEPGQQPEQPPQPATFEEWIKDQPDDVKDLIDNRLTNLQSALSSERTERKKLADQLKQISGQLEQGSEAQKALGEISGQLEVSNRRADFYEQASIAGIFGSSIKLAWAAVGADNLFEEYLNHRTNKVDWNGLFERMKTDYPNLFTAPVQPRVPNGNAGTGTTATPTAPMDMNRLILRAARRVP